MKHLNESILSKKTGQYSSKEFPRTPDKDLIINWLEDNGFELVMPKLPDTIYWPSKVLREARRMNENIYSLGQYYSGDPQSHVILFSDGETCFRVNTSGDTTDLNFEIYDNSQFAAIEKYKTFDEFRKQVKKYLKIR